MFVCLFVWLFVCLFGWLFVCLFVWMLGTRTASSSGFIANQPRASVCRWQGSYMAMLSTLLHVLSLCDVLLWCQTELQLTHTAVSVELSLTSQRNIDLSSISWHLFKGFVFKLTRYDHLKREGWGAGRRAGRGAGSGAWRGRNGSRERGVREMTVNVNS